MNAMQSVAIAMGLPMNTFGSSSDIQKAAKPIGETKATYCRPQYHSNEIMEHNGCLTVFPEMGSPVLWVPLDRPLQESNGQIESDQ